MNNLHTLLTSDISRTKKIQEIAQMTKPYLLAQELLRYYEDSEHLREEVLRLETEKDALKAILGVKE